MNNTIYNFDLTRTLPPSLKNDPKIIALSKIIADELSKNNALISKNIIYARIDELNEETLDVLAYDLHVDWYDYGYPIEAKRAVIKDSVKVHKRLGTKFAVETALGDLYPKTYIEEWFEYGGKPFTFRVVLDVTNSRVTAEYFSIIKTVNFYKRLSAHLESLVYQCTINIGVLIGTKYFIFKSGMTGKNKSGTLPYRNIEGGINKDSVEINPDTDFYKFYSEAAGTYPYKNIKAQLTDKIINAIKKTDIYNFKSELTGENEAGTKPYKVLISSLENKNINALTDGQGFKFESELTGMDKIGSIPYRDYKGGLTHDLIESEIKLNKFRFTNEALGTYPYRNIEDGFGYSNIESEINLDEFIFTNEVSGTYPYRNIKNGSENSNVESNIDANSFKFETEASGIVPGRNTNSNLENGGISAASTIKNFSYKVKRCGTKRR